MYDLQSQWNNNHQTDHELSRITQDHDEYIDRSSAPHFGYRGVRRARKSIAVDLDRADELHAENY